MVYNSKKYIFFLPNIFTALNMACGFGSVLLTINGDFYKACLLLLLGAIFDSVDGRVARLTGTESSFGEQFDSMSELITFGFAPMILVYMKFLIGLGRFGMVVAFIYLLCGALRLARFNTNIEKTNPSYFQGLPIPGACLALIGLVLISCKLPIINSWSWAVLIYVLVYAVLMISNVYFYSFKKSNWVKKHKKAVFIFAIIIFCAIFIELEYSMFIIITVYSLASMIYFVMNKGNLDDIFLWQNEKEMDE